MSVEKLYNMSEAAFDKLAYSDKYYLYLETDAWKKISKRLRNKAKKCECCGCDSDLVVHHVSYDNTDLLNIGNEYRSDVVVVCRSCHKKAHNGSIVFIVVNNEPNYKSLREILSKSKILCDGDTQLHYILKNKLRLFDTNSKISKTVKKQAGVKNKRVYLVYLSYYRFKYNTFPVKRIFHSRPDAEQYIRDYPSCPRVDLNIKEMVVH